MANTKLLETVCLLYLWNIDDSMKSMAAHKGSDWGVGRLKKLGWVERELRCQLDKTW